MSDFCSYFLATTGHAPFPYQEAFAGSEAIADLLHVPTGAGKTAAVVVGWMWRRFEAPESVRAATPRRLILCLPMRTLVEQTERVVRGWLAKAGLHDVGVHVLMGGALDQAWDDGPDRPCVLVGTQDQLLSRALLRGYGMRRFRWPIHFAQLHNDALWVFDEVQLMGVGASTSAQLEALRRSLGTARPSRSIWMTATPSPGALATVDLRAHALTAVGLTEADRRDAGLTKRLTARKPCTVVALDGKRRDDDLAALVTEQHVAGTFTLVVVNRVDRAQAVFAALRRSPSAEQVRLIHGRFRPVDRRAQEDALAPGFTGVLVATQAVEAGVDVSARLLVTDMASWSSLVQRFGRCNRYGECDDARVVVADVPEGDEAPYTAEAVAVARAHLAGLDDVGPVTLEGIPVETGEPSLPVLRRKDLLELFDTEADLEGHDLDVSRFVRDADTLDVQVAWRELGGEGPPDTMRSPVRDELCRVPLVRGKAWLDKATLYAWDALEGRWNVAWRPVPGGVYVVDVGAGGYAAALGFTGSTRDRPEPVAVPADLEPPEADGDDPLSLGCDDYVALATHADDVVGQLEALAARLGGEDPWSVLRDAARWHDLGKVHPAFQAMLTQRLDGEDPRRAGGPWAKSDGAHGGRMTPARSHFRHELASALAWLDAGGDDLTAFLIAAHHGKVRTRLRARPTETSAVGERRQALGVRDGDVLPAADLGGGVHTAAVTLSLEVMSLGEGEAGRSWTERVAGLLALHGPFRLAWWETLVRIADWRGTALRKEVRDAA